MRLLKNLFLYFILLFSFQAVAGERLALKYSEANWEELEEQIYFDRLVEDFQVLAADTMNPSREIFSTDHSLPDFQKAAKRKAISFGYTLPLRSEVEPCNYLAPFAKQINFGTRFLFCIKVHIHLHLYQLF